MSQIFIFIDDESICNFISKTKLIQYNKDSKILTFESAKEALQYFGSNSKQLALDELFIYLDINMPVMDGFDFLKEYEKKYASTFHVRICMLTSSNNIGDKKKAFKYPFVKNFHTKPFQVAYLHDMSKLNPEVFV